MARILVQTNDRHTVLDEDEVRLVEGPGDDELPAELLERLNSAVRRCEGPSRPRRRARPQRKLRSIVPVTDYRELRG